MANGCRRWADDGIARSTGSLINRLTPLREISKRSTKESARATPPCLYRSTDRSRISLSLTPTLHFRCILDYCCLQIDLSHHARNALVHVKIAIHSKSELLIVGNVGYSCNTEKKLHEQYLTWVKTQQVSVSMSCP